MSLIQLIKDCPKCDEYVWMVAYDQGYETDQMIVAFYERRDKNYFPMTTAIQDTYNSTNKYWAEL